MILNALRDNGLQNNEGDRVKVMFVPAYLNGNDGIFNMKYNEFLYAFDLSAFPSYYERPRYPDNHHGYLRLRTIYTEPKY